MSSLAGVAIHLAANRWFLTLVVMPPKKPIERSAAQKTLNRFLGLPLDPRPVQSTLSAAAFARPQPRPSPFRAAVTRSPSPLPDLAEVEPYMAPSGDPQHMVVDSDDDQPQQSASGELQLASPVASDASKVNKLTRDLQQPTRSVSRLFFLLVTMKRNNSRKLSLNHPKVSCL